MLMSSNGALGVVGLTPFLHIRVVTEMFGDGIVFGTFFTVHDPGLYKPSVEVFQSFAEQYEDVAYITHRMDKMLHASTGSTSLPGPPTHLRTHIKPHPPIPRPLPSGPPLSTP